MEKTCSVCGAHLIFMNFPPRNWEGNYAYSSRVGGKLCLLIGVRTLPLLSRHKNPPIHRPLELHRFGSWYIFALCFTKGKAHGWWTFPKCGARLGYHLILGPLFCECPYPRALPYTKFDSSLIFRYSGLSHKFSFVYFIRKFGHI